MGIVKRQSFKYSILSGIAMLLGVINVLLIYPEFIDFYGYSQAAIQLIALLIPFSQLGLRSVIFRYGHTLVNGNKNSIFLFSLMWLGVSVSFFLFWMLIFDNQITYWFLKISEDFSIFIDHKWEILILLALTNLATILITISTAFNRIVLPHLIRGIISQKILLPIVIVIVGINKFPFYYILYFLILRECIICMLLLYYSFKQGWVTFSVPSSLNKEKKEEIVRFGLYATLNESSNLFAFSIDIVMVNVLLGNTATGIYAIFMFLANVLKIPISSIAEITLPIIAKLFEENKIDQISDYYKRTSIALLCIILGGFILIQLSIEDLLNLLGKENLLSGVSIFWILSIGIIVNAGTALNGSLIIQSEYYKWNLLFTILLAGINCYLTYYFIVYYFDTPYKIYGAAVSTVISLIIVNFVKTIFVYFKMKLLPFSWKTVAPFILAGICFTIDLFIPETDYLMVNIFIRSLILGFIYFGSVYYFRLSEDINDFVDKSISKYK